MSSERLLQRPIFGGVFGQGQYALASMPCVNRGLHSIKYMVVEPKGGAVLSIAEDRAEALASARRVIEGSMDVAPGERIPVQMELGLQEPEASVESGPPLSPGLRPVSRRRQDIFSKSKGRCHYCGAALELHGAWHVEHMRPRALGGDDSPLNLVAACTPCNLAKSDRTALEFVAGRVASA